MSHEQLSAEMKATADAVLRPCEANPVGRREPAAGWIVARCQHGADPRPGRGRSIGARSERRRAEDAHAIRPG